MKILRKAWIHINWFSKSNFEQIILVREDTSSEFWWECTAHAGSSWSNLAYWMKIILNIEFLTWLCSWHQRILLPKQTYWGDVPQRSRGGGAVLVRYERMFSRQPRMGNWMIFNSFKMTKSASQFVAQIIILLYYCSRYWRFVKKRVTRQFTCFLYLHHFRYRAVAFSNIMYSCTVCR